ncbi:S-methyl thiohydantoin desulfurase domain-containing protein [Ferrovum myxofaciens]|uniref:S-methyl thiohydantoin desulfurase domain-containing protein n=1 Tax=Ferrovum myxofaciens TaxID=416213 RepID=UPI002357FEFB|nr:DUF917 family protein [Ferrovum myxofaciens]
MTIYKFGITDFQCIAAGAAVLGSGGGGSYSNAVTVIEELAGCGWQGSVQVRDYDGSTNCCVLAMMGSPDVADSLTLADIKYSIVNTLNTFESATGTVLGCVIPGEIGPINSIVPLIAAAISNKAIWVVNGDGAGRAVPELPQTTYGGSVTLAAGPCALANNAEATPTLQSSLLNAATAAQIETLAGGIVSVFGSYAGIALWPSNSINDYALTGGYIAETLSQTWAFGKFLSSASTPPSTAEVALQIAGITGRTATATLNNFYITAVTQSTTSASLDAGIIRLDNNPDQAKSTETHYIYNLNENLIMYSSLSNMPDIIAPDSICYYSETTGLGFSNATNDLAVYFDTRTGRSTGYTVSIIKVEAASKLYSAAGVMTSFGRLLRDIGYAGALPYSV